MNCGRCGKRVLLFVPYQKPAPCRQRESILIKDSSHRHYFDILSGLLEIITCNAIVKCTFEYTLQLVSNVYTNIVQTRTGFGFIKTDYDIKVKLAKHSKTTDPFHFYTWNIFANIYMVCFKTNYQLIIERSLNFCLQFIFIPGARIYMIVLFMFCILIVYIVNRFIDV